MLKFWKLASRTRRDATQIEGQAFPKQLKPNMVRGFGAGFRSWPHILTVSRNKLEWGTI